MYTSLFEHNSYDQDAILIADLIDAAIIQQNFKLDVIVHFMKNGCFAVVCLGKSHNATWNISWCSDKPYIIDTGIGGLSIFNPNFQDILINHIIKITMIMVALCDCQECQEKVAEDFLPSV